MGSWMGSGAGLDNDYILENFVCPFKVTIYTVNKKDAKINAIKRFGFPLLESVET
jgi:hypothetical protein